MKRFSIKQLVIGFIIGSVLLSGAQLFAMHSSDAWEGNREKVIQERRADGDFSNAQLKEYLEQGGSHRGFGIAKHR